MNLKEIINESTIFFLEQKSKYKVLDELIEKAYASEKIKDRDIFKKAISDREMLISTGIGLGVAIPHAKLKNIDNFFVLTGILKEPVDWDSIDQKPVHAVFLIGGPSHNQNEYLTLLSQIIVIVKNDEKRDIIFNAKKPQDILNLL